MYLFLICSTINSLTSSLSFLNNRYTFPLAQSHDPRSFLQAFFHFVSYQRLLSTCEIFSELDFLPQLQILLLSLSHPISPTFLLLTLSLLSHLSLSSSSSDFLSLLIYLLLLSSFLPSSVFAILTFPTLAFTAFYTPLDTLLSLLLLPSN